MRIYRSIVNRYCGVPAPGLAIWEWVIELAPFYRAMGWAVQLLKGDRGARDGQYLLIFEIASAAERDRWVPTPGHLSEEGEKIFATWGPVWEKIEKLAIIFLDDTKFTDYVMINE